jgi:CheY-like chemotaxis protein
MLILVVDDEKGPRRLIQRICEQQGHKVVLAENGDEALQVLRTNRVDLLITDNDMPKLKGLELIGLVQPQLPKLKIILVSGRPPANIPSGVLFIEKPFPLEIMEQALKETQ